MDPAGSDRALVVTADPEAAGAIRSTLGHAYRVTVTADPIEAAHLLELEPVDAVFVEQGAAGAGLDLLARALDARPDALRVLLAAQLSVESALWAVNTANVTAILQKPLGPSELAVLARCLDRASRRRDALRAEHDALSRRQRELVEDKRALTREVEDKASAIARLGRQLDSLSIRDDRTGLFNERYLHDRADEEIKRARRRSAPLSLVLCDVDATPPQDGRSSRHAVEEVLADVARLVASGSRDGPGLHLRDSDVVTRYGECAIGLLLPDTPRGGAEVVASRLRAVLAGIRFKARGAGGCSLRVGFACYPDEAQSRGELIERADQALYQAGTRGLTQPLLLDD